LLRFFGLLMIDTSPEWITLTAASRLLGVHPMTLRAWVDAGALHAFRTPGGHRRFQVSELRDFLNQHRTDQTTRALTVAPDQTLQQVRKQLSAEPVTRSNWYLRLSEAQRARQRELGQRLLGLLLQFVSRRENAGHFLVEGRVLAEEYGRDLAQAGLSAGELARAFLFFRRMIVSAAYPSEGLSSQGDAEGLRLLGRINTFMDELLVATLDAYDRVRRTEPRTRTKLQNLQKSARVRKLRKK
jgi:excisionase family DNA binding protein